MMIGGKNIFINTLMLGVMVGFCACNSSDEKVFKESGNSEIKPTSILIPGPTVLDSQEATATIAATVTYDVRIVSPSQAELCKGDAAIEIYTDFTMKFPDATLQCASMKLDLAGMLGAAPLQGGVGVKDEGNLKHDGKVLSVTNLGNAHFEPARPFILGPVVQDASKYKNFERTTTHTLTGQDPKTGGTLSGSGSFKIEVFDYKTSYSNSVLNEKFKNILHWQISTSGFKDIPAVNGLIFERWEWFWNTNPIMIPKLTIVGRISDFIAGPAGGSADQFLGTLTVNLIAKDFKIK
jgi:hypothetical protein